MLYKNASKKSRSLFATLLLVFSLSADLYAAPGDLDPTFGNGGVVTTKMSNDYDVITDIKLQPDGKVVTAGLVYRICDGGYDTLCNLPMRLAFINRYLSTGVLDKSFGNGGKIIFTHKDGEYISKIALQPDGKIVAVGHLLGGGSAIVFRYNANGTLDASFGTGGKAVPSLYGSALGVVIQPDGKIVVNESFGVVRYNADGSLDAAFGTGGTASVAASDMALQPDGKIVASGSGFFHYVLLRLNSNGTLDSTFGAGGYAITDIAGGAYAVALQPDGKILVNGSSGIVRYNTNGSIDTSFAINGVFASEIDVSQDIALQADGKIVAAGGYSGFALTRLNPDGSPDTSFGTNGNVITLIDGSRGSVGNALALQPDGKILSGGSIYQSSGIADAAIVRFSGE